MGIFARIKDEIRYLSNLLPLLKAVKDISNDSSNLLTDDIERLTVKFGDNIAFVGDDLNWTYKQFDAYANKVARWALNQGFKKGDTVAIYVSNRTEYVALWFGLSKVGVIPALLNFNLFGPPLKHCLSISHPRAVIVDAALEKPFRKTRFKEGELTAELWGAFGAIDGMQDFDRALLSEPTTRPSAERRSGIKAGDTLMKMFTSGTTGLPKVANVSHARAQRYFRAFGLCLKAEAKDRMMLVLPLYHATGGLCGVGAALTYGAAVIVRPGFSASRFWDDARDYQATLFTYVGELCRFLANVEPRLDDKAHSIRGAVGNGIGEEIWNVMKDRFGLETIVEFYGSTEGNVSFINVNGKPGAIGRLPKYIKGKFNIELIKYDVETDSHPRDENGHCTLVEDNEVGECIGEIRTDDARFAFEGYDDKQATEKKILHDVLSEGDAWFRTGDLLRRDEEGWFFFVDRVGDTYRWKAENVSTGEVAAAISAVPGIEVANVYGVEVPGYGGRAGMAAIDIEKGFSLEVLWDEMIRTLPPYARPVFLRLQETHDTTGTFKLRKVDLVKEGYDPSKVKDTLYVADDAAGKYVKITKGRFEKIRSGEMRL